MGPTATHVVLLGDSIFDNGAYTGGEPDVVTHLRKVLPGGWHATLCAVDGATIAELADQLPRIPPNGSHVVVAIGGNDALQHSDVLSRRVGSSAEALQILAERVAQFESDYRAALDAVVELNFKTCVCTIYNGALDPAQATIAKAALAVFNDVIVRTAIDVRVDLLELRSVCTEPADYATPIEPSGRGGRKIALAVAQVVGALANSQRPTHAWNGHIGR
jgi:lysophospholipase L1-like esterase